MQMFADRVTFELNRPCHHHFEQLAKVHAAQVLMLLPLFSFLGAIVFAEVLTSGERSTQKLCFT